MNPFTKESIMASKNTQKPTPRDSKPAKRGEIKDRDLDKVSGGMSAAGLPTGKRMVTTSRSGDPCEGGE
jgi:hypothetical protein